MGPAPGNPLLTGASPAPSLGHDQGLQVCERPPVATPESAPSRRSWWLAEQRPPWPRVVGVRELA